MKFSPAKSLYGLMVALLLGVFLLQLALSIRHQSQTFDEGFHLVAGYRYWQCGDFGINSEHPPLVKFVAAAPLWLAGAPAPAGVCGKEPTTKDYGYGLGVGYLYGQGLDGDALLYRARLATTVFTLILGLTCYFFASTLFGRPAGLVALGLLVFEPTILAHGALITTDTAVTAFLLATVFAFYRYYRQPSFARLLLTGILTGLTFASKHSGVLVVPILLVLAVVEYVRSRREAFNPASGQINSIGLLRRTLNMVTIFLVGVLVLWSMYGLRFTARPMGRPMTTQLGQFIHNARLQGTHGPMLTVVIPELARWNQLPEAYLYGLVDVLNVSDPGQPPFLLGKLYSHGRWFYFPVVFVIKSTLGFLALLALSLIFGSWRFDRFWSFLYLVLPPVVILLVAMQSGLNIGYRHVLPIVPFLCILIAGGTVALWERKRGWKIAVAVLLLAHVASSLRAYPNYLPYSNEAWGGPMQSYRYLTDSNVDWGQGLYQTRDYLMRNSIRDCWIAYDGAASLSYYGIPCRKLPANAGHAGDIPPAEVNGLFVLGDLAISGIEWEPGDLNPYREFLHATPVANIGGAMLVYRGQFDLHGVQAATHIARALKLVSDTPAEAMAEAQDALALTPQSARAHLILGQALAALGRKEEARREFETALALADGTGSAWYPLQIATARQGLDKLHAGN